MLPAGGSSDTSPPHLTLDQSTVQCVSGTRKSGVGAGAGEGVPECARELGDVDEPVLQEEAVAGVEVAVRAEVELQAASRARRVEHEGVKSAVSAGRAAHSAQHRRPLADTVPNLLAHSTVQYISKLSQ